MNMYREEKTVLCASNAYEKKYYFNPDFDALPDSIKDELENYVRVIYGRNRRYSRPRI